MNSNKDKIVKQIQSLKAGDVFSAKDFIRIAPRGTVDVILGRLTREGVIRRINRGLYDCPQQSKFIDGPMSPNIDLTAQAIARKHRWTIAPDGAMAANMLGLSQQVPAKIIYLSDGPRKEITIGNQVALFRHAGTKELRMVNYSSRLIAQALRYLGKSQVDNKIIMHLQNNLSNREKKRFLKDAHYGTDWILEMAQKLNLEIANE